MNFRIHFTMSLETKHELFCLNVIRGPGTITHGDTVRVWDGTRNTYLTVRNTENDTRVVTHETRVNHPVATATLLETLEFVVSE